MKLQLLVLSIFLTLIFLLIGVEVFLPIVKPEMAVKPIMFFNLFLLFGSLVFLTSVEPNGDPSDYSIGGKLIVAFYVLSFLLVLIFFVLYFIFDITRPAIYDLFVLEIALGIALFNALKLDLNL